MKCDSCEFMNDIDATACIECMKDNLIQEEFVIIYGKAYIGQRTAKRLKEHGYHKLEFVSGLPREWGQDVSPIWDALKRHPSALVVVCNYNYSNTLEYCKSFTDKAVSFVQFYDKYPGLFYPFMNLDVPGANLVSHKEPSSLFADKQSVVEITTQLWWREDHDDGVLLRHLPQSMEHFDYPMILTDHDNFVDCGAHDGDTIREFISRVGDNYDSITAIEPNDFKFPSNVLHYQCALGSQNGTTLFSLNRSQYDSIGTGQEVKVRTLDHLLDHDKVYFIKMDIEGAELDALHGAVELLKAGKSKWSICLYHKPADLWEIPLFIHSINPAYKLYLRRYAEWSSDLIFYVMP